MNNWSVLILCVTCVWEGSGREPVMPARGSVGFIVYFASRYRGLCVGTLVSRTAVLTAAVCVTNPVAIRDTRPVNVVLGTAYRHARRGIRVQVSKILIPNLSSVLGERGYLMEKSVAVLLLKRKVPDVLMEVPARPIHVDYMGDTPLVLQEDCLMAGWHFFYKGDEIYPVNRFLLQRNLRVQSLNIVKKTVYCETLSLKFRKALSNLGFHGYIDVAASVCVRDGMYGSPLICQGKVVGVMMSPDAQWTNCTGFSNMVHVLRSGWLRNFFLCVSRLFEVTDGDVLDWRNMKKSIFEGASGEQYDYVDTLYDRLYAQPDDDDD